jgi:hypothetical protein
MPCAAAWNKKISSKKQIQGRLNRLAWLLDASIPIPGTRFSIGLDALIGLVPFLGDLVGVLLSTYIVGEAARLGASRTVLARMVFNVAVEGLAGLVPLAGDVFDAAWKANQRNVRLLAAWLEQPRRTQRTSVLFMAGLIVALLAIATVPIVLTYLLIRWLA